MRPFPKSKQLQNRPPFRAGKVFQGSAFG